MNHIKKSNKLNLGGLKITNEVSGNRSVTNDNAASRNNERKANRV